VLKNPEPETANPEPGPAIADLLENLELQLEHAQAMARHSPNVFLKASMNIAAVEMFSVLNRFDTVTLSKRLEEKPELYFQLLNSQCNLAKAHLDHQKLEFKKKQAKAKQREREQKLRAQKPILITTGTLDALNQTLHHRSRRRLPGRSFPAKAGEEAEHSPVHNAHPPEPQTVNPAPSVTANTGSTDAIDVAYQPPATSNTSVCSVCSVNSVLKNPEPQTMNAEPCFEPSFEPA
jgi:hypothetical protein